MDERPVQEQRTDARDNDRRAVTAVAALALIIIVVLILLLLPRCGGDQQGSSAGNKRIVAVPDAAAEPGIISVWIDESRSIEAILSDARLSVVGFVDMEGGRYVVSVAPGGETDGVRRLRGTAGVIDAGYVYEE